MHTAASATTSTVSILKPGCRNPCDDAGLFTQQQDTVIHGTIGKPAPGTPELMNARRDWGCALQRSEVVAKGVTPGHSCEQARLPGIRARGWGRAHIEHVVSRKVIVNIKVAHFPGRSLLDSKGLAHLQTHRLGSHRWFTATIHDPAEPLPTIRALRVGRPDPCASSLVAEMVSQANYIPGCDNGGNQSLSGHRVRLVQS